MTVNILSRRAALTALVTAAITVSTVQAVPAASAQGVNNDPALQQTVAPDERIAPAGERTVISAGHADLGPIYVDGQLQFMVRDDSKVPPVWRRLDDVVLDVSDDAVQTLPEGGDFDFTGAKPGERVWVIPQNEVAGVPWLGWNTQSPSLLERAESGINLEFGGHGGPGDFTLFLQSGGFGQPQQLWNSRLEGDQPMWVELNTHTHANWVFTEPGVHTVAIRAVITTKDGGTEVSEQVLRLAVGSGTGAEQAAGAVFDGPWRTADGDGAREGDRAGDGAGTEPSALGNTGGVSPVTWALVGTGVAALILVAVSAAMLKRARSRRDEALAAVRTERAGGDQ